MASRKSPRVSPADYWHSLLRPDVELAPAYFEDFAAKMRAARLTFGDRVHCPFLRPFFLSELDEARIVPVCETIAALGERIAAAAMDSPDLMRQVGLRESEERLARIDPGYARASTASRLDSFLLPDSLQFAEYNAESPAGPGYTELLGEIFDQLPVMARFKKRFAVRSYAPMNRLLNALLESYHEWGGKAAPPQIAIVDWRGVPTWNEFGIIQERFERLGVPTLVCEPTDLEFNGRALTAHGKRIDLLYRRVLINDIIERPAECAALVSAYQARAVCVANTFRCKIPHKKAFFAVLTDERNDALFSSAERDLVRQHVPWTRLIADTGTTYGGKRVNLLAHIRNHRETLVIKPNDEYGGAGVTLGWEMNAAEWDGAIEKALKESPGTWIVQEKIAIRREMFPMAQPGQSAVLLDMLVDSAPYLFRGRLSGFLTRLSATGLANVTSGGGQVPVFIVSSEAAAPRGKRR
jgi:uncharacterized circularly permuted ATP-grasp superfamily protein